MLYCFQSRRGVRDRSALTGSTDFHPSVSNLNRLTECFTKRPMIL